MDVDEEVDEEGRGHKVPKIVGVIGMKAPDLVPALEEEHDKDILVGRYGN